MLAGFGASAPSISVGSSGRHEYSALAPIRIPVAAKIWSPFESFYIFAHGFDFPGQLLAK